jgi:hypothetical protein
MHVDRTTMFLPQWPKWSELESLLAQIASSRDVRIRLISTTNERLIDSSAIFVRINALTGDAECELDVEWNGNCKLGDDAFGFRVCHLMQSAVILRNYDDFPTPWMRLKPGFGIEDVVIDDDLLRTRRCVRCRVA